MDEGCPPVPSLYDCRDLENTWLLRSLLCQSAKCVDWHQPHRTFVYAFCPITRLNTISMLSACRGDRLILMPQQMGALRLYATLPIFEGRCRRRL